MSVFILLTPLPEKNPTSITTYCNLIETELNKLKTENTFCSNVYDAYPLCYFIPNPECE